MDRYTINLIIVHPNMDPINISDKLKLKPNVTQKQGDQIITPKGKIVGGIYKYSRWTYKLEFDDSQSLNTKLISLIDHLYDYRKILSDIGDGQGSSTLFLNLTDPESLTLILNNNLMKKLSGMEVQFGFEIFV